MPRGETALVLLIDHFDSFVFNQARYLERLGVRTAVERCDVVSVSTVARCRPAAIVLSPGPCTPAETGNTLEIVRAFWGAIPMLGICLGHQALAVATGGSVVRARRPCHGRASRIVHDQLQEYAGVPQGFVAARYHSLVVHVDDLPDCWVQSAHTTDGLLMGMRHRELPIFGWQFHPESVLTSHGFLLLGNFLRRAGMDIVRDMDLDSGSAECPADAWSETSDEDWQPPCSRDGTPLSF